MHRVPSATTFAIALLGAALGCDADLPRTLPSTATSGAAGGSGGASTGAAPAGSTWSSGAGGNSSGSALEGFGTETPGGAGGESCVVTSLDDAGPGTLRDCVSASNRHVTFAVGGTIELATTLSVAGQGHITIDGASAPAPGITVTAGTNGVEGALFSITDASHDIIVSHLRFRDATDTSTGDAVRIYAGSHHIVFDHCSARRGADGGFDITSGVHDVTVQWSIIAETVKNQLVSYGVDRLSLHHNLYVHGSERNPQLSEATNVDMVNNVIVDWAGNYGTRIREGSTANLVANAYLPGPSSDAEDAVVIEVTSGAQVYSEGNQLPTSASAEGNLSTRLAAPPVTEMTAAEALEAVLTEAGAQPRDADDTQYILDVDAL
jgi:pectate lyase